MAIQSLSYCEAIVYGCIQGITEFLPVSSSGHLALAHQLGLGHIDDALMRPFSVLLHVATLVAVLWAFRREIVRALLNLNKSAWINSCVSIVPPVIVGLSLSALVSVVEGNMLFLGLSFSFTAILLLITDVVIRRRAHLGQEPLAQTASASTHPIPASDGPTPELSSLSIKQAIWVGLGQAIALLPGVSRSGSSICAAVLTGVERRTAFVYSFLVGIPLIAGAAAHEFLLTKEFAPMIDAIGWGAIACSMLAALVTGLGAIALLRLVITKRCLSVFGVYCGLLAALCLFYALK